jgi:hypothetical protein
MAWDLFGKTPPTHERVQAVMDWVHKNVSFGYRFARHNKTAYDTWYEQKGVCRDYQHLAIALLRALNIPRATRPATSATSAPRPCPLPGDFSAWMEVFLGGQWITLDARHNTPRIGRILMASGRDATDVALTTSFGSAKLCGFKVWTEECGEALINQEDAVFVPPTPPSADPGRAGCARPPAAPLAPAPAAAAPTPTPPPMPVAAYTRACPRSRPPSPIGRRRRCNPSGCRGAPRSSLGLTWRWPGPPSWWHARTLVSWTTGICGR